ncbi:MAG TPA: RNase adapter RapZ [Burkholderiales bacterium]|nr:RNase adapter RapZ [Burkholderiales bacterium]
MRVILVTGMSGSGKSIALNVLEDIGYYCVDNLPANLLVEVVDFLAQSGYARVGVSVDVRSGPTLKELPASVVELRRRQVDLRVLFLDAKTGTLVKRFSETRRRHPLSDDARTLPECIDAERAMLQDIVALAHRIDTSELNTNALRAWVKDFAGLAGSGMTLLFQSFGFKHGIPLDADLVFDVRCLPNPHYDPVLQPLTGNDDQVIAFMEADADAQKMLADISAFLDAWLPCYLRDNRSYLTVAIGCTGGRHRSVYFSEVLARRFEPTLPVIVRHRELAQ